MSNSIFIKKMINNFYEIEYSIENKKTLNFILNTLDKFADKKYCFNLGSFKYDNNILSIFKLKQINITSNLIDNYANINFNELLDLSYYCHKNLICKLHRYIFVNKQHLYLFIKQILKKYNDIKILQDII